MGPTLGSSRVNHITPGGESTPPLSHYPGPVAPIRLAIVNDYEIVVRGLAALIESDRRFAVVDITTDDSVDTHAEIALYDTFGAADPEFTAVRRLLDENSVDRVAVFTWSFDESHIERATKAGVSGFLSKALTSGELADALQRIDEGEFVVSPTPDPRSDRSTVRRWPGQSVHLTEKEADVLALITQGHDNRSIAEMLYISPNTLKTRVRGLYRKIGASNRVQAALWGVDNGFLPPDSDTAGNALVPD